MEANNNKNYGEKQQQEQKVVGKRKADDDQQPTAAASEKGQQPAEKGRKMDCEDSWKWNDDGDLELDLEELEQLSREDLINIVRKQLAEKNAIKKTAEERVKQAEREKMEHHEDMRKKLAEITEMHKDAEAKSKELAEKDKQINALLSQLNESRQDQSVSPPTDQQEKEMKIQMSKEVWFDMFSFVPRHQLGQVVPKIGDRRFAAIVQPFLHEYGQISLDKIWQIVAPYEEHPSDSGPRVRVCYKEDEDEDGEQQVLRVEMADVPMPANITNFESLQLSYLDPSVLTFIQKFQQHGLLDNVNLSFGDSGMYNVHVLPRLLPLLNDIVSIEVANSKFMVDIYNNDAANSNEEFSALAMEMMAKPRHLAVGFWLSISDIDLYCRWLFQKPRADGKPRVLHISLAEYPQISAFTDRLRHDFQMATHPIPFFICIHWRLEAFKFQSQVGICLKNDKTNERFITKLGKAPDLFGDADEKEDALLISRLPIAATKQWIDGMEKEVLDWNSSNVQKRTISLGDELKFGNF